MLGKKLGKMKNNLKTLEDIWNQVPPDYYQRGVRDNLFQWIWHNWKWNSMKQLLKDSNIRPLKILDIGCASGYLTSQINTLFPQAEVAGIDSYKRAIEYGQKNYPNIKFKVADAHRLPFRDESFDLITCIETLEHLEAPEGAIREIHRLLKRKGKVLIGQDTDNLLFKVIWSVWTKSRGKVWHSSHIHPYGPKELEKFIKASGLKIVKRKLSHLGLEIFFLAEKSNS